MDGAITKEWLDDLKVRAVDLRNRLRRVEQVHPSDASVEAADAGDDVLAAVEEVVAEVGR
jgi:hypothetical protein